MMDTGFPAASLQYPMCAAQLMLLDAIMNPKQMCLRILTSVTSPTGVECITVH